MKLEENTIQKTSKIVVLDGECVVCNRFFHFLLKYDKRQVLQFATLQSEWAKATILKYFKNETVPDSIILFEGNRLYFKSSAALRAIASLGSFWSIVKILLWIPKLFHDMIYDFVARNRFNWWGKKACLIPDANLRERFVENGF